MRECEWGIINGVDTPTVVFLEAGGFEAGWTGTLGRQLE